MQFSDALPILQKAKRLVDPDASDSFFVDFEKRLENPAQRRYYEEFESLLRTIDPPNRDRFLGKLARAATKRGDASHRPWREFDDTLNELLGYQWLTDQGGCRITFLEERSGWRAKTPDFQAELPNQPILVEVKTIRATSLLGPQAFAIRNHRSPIHKVAAAYEQLSSFSSDSPQLPAPTRLVCFLVVEKDTTISPEEISERTRRLASDAANRLDTTLFVASKLKTESVHWTANSR